MFTAIHDVKEATTCSNVRVSSHAFNKPVSPSPSRSPNRIESHNVFSARRSGTAELSVIIFVVVMVVVDVVSRRLLLFTYRHNSARVTSNKYRVLRKNESLPFSLSLSLPVLSSLALDYPANNSAHRRGDGNYFSLVKNEKCSTAE